MPVKRRRGGRVKLSSLNPGFAPGRRGRGIGSFLKKVYNVGKKVYHAGRSVYDKLKDTKAISRGLNLAGDFIPGAKALGATAEAAGFGRRRRARRVGRAVRRAGGRRLL